MSDAPEKPKRRPRYPGRNPRRFTDKYKEHAPARYAADVAKVLARGRTPAGTHRPVMVDEVLEVLAPRTGDLAVDCTLGYGGHARRLLLAIQPGGQLIGLDIDPIELPKTEARLREPGCTVDSLALYRMNYAGLAGILPRPADVILADLGVSSMQIDNPERGFTYKYDGPLDLRMNPQRGAPASALLARLEAEELAVLLRDNADEPNPEELARALQRKSIASTTDLAAVIRRAGRGEDSVRRVFQALRIAVNDEFGALDALLRNLPRCLQPGGRVAILTFHSGEDRRVKHAFQSGQRDGTYEAISGDALRPAPAEVRANRRSQSAKLRWARRS